ncbi:Uma2 family endonuclease [Myxococcota bacterium]|nr:Uma2 family endonuclease [Myxococcota bacterium]
MSEELAYFVVPPRAEDLPYDDGVPLETVKHRSQMELLIGSLQLAWRDRRDYFVGGNMFFYFSLAQVKSNDFRGPDVFVVLGTDQRSRLSWVTWEEDGKRPDLIIELTSASTWRIDHGKKKEVYASLGIPEYFIFDPADGTLEAFRLDVDEGAYVDVLPGANGRHRSTRLGLELGVVTGTFRSTEPEPWLRWFDAEGHMLLHGDERSDEEAERATREAERAAREAERADAAEARARALAERLAEYERRFGGLDPERR